MNTSGFYRIDVNGDFQYAPNFVRAPDYDLDIANKDTYTYPTDGGWYYFDNEDAAKAFFNVE